MAGVSGEFSPPLPIDAGHDVLGFACGSPTLDDWLKQTALKAEGRSARTYVVCEADAVIGYHALATGSVMRRDAPGSVRRNMPEPVPMIVIARLAVATRVQGRGIGRGLLRDAMRRALQASDIVGCRAVLVHAIDQAATDFYAAHGFTAFPDGSRTMFLHIETLAASL